MPCDIAFTNTVSWRSWMGMGDRPGGTVVRGFGTKIAGLDALPADVMAGVRRFVPEILDTKNWKEFMFEDTEYLRERASDASPARGK